MYRRSKSREVVTKAREASKGKKPLTVVSAAVKSGKMSEKLSTGFCNKEVSEFSRSEFCKC